MRSTQFGDVIAAPTSWSENQIVFLVPDAVQFGRYDLFVTVAGLTSKSVSYLVGAGISDVVPAAATAGDEVTILGGGFGTTGSITIGGAYVETISWSDTQVVVRVLERVSNGVQEVLAEVPGSKTRIPGAIRVYPTLYGITPQLGSGEERFVLTGTNLWRDSTVMIAGLAEKTVVPQPLEISFKLSAEVRASTTPVTVYVATPGGASNAVDLVVVPVIDQVDTTLEVSEIVRLRGRNFGPDPLDSTLTIGGTPVTLLSWSSTEIQFRVPISLAAGAYTLALTVGGQVVTRQVSITPAVTTISPAGGTGGDLITVQGFSFGDGANSAILVSGRSIPIDSWDNRTIKFTIPDDLSGGRLPLMVKVGTFESEIDYLDVYPTIFDFSPKEGPVGTHITLTGKNFPVAGSVRVGSVEIPSSSWTVSSGSAVLSAYPDPGMQVLEVCNVVCSREQAWTFNVIPTFDRLEAPADTYVGTVLKFFGSNLGRSAGASEVRVGTLKAAVKSWSPVNIEAYVPDLPPGPAAVSLSLAPVSADIYTFQAGNITVMPNILNVDSDRKVATRPEVGGRVILRGTSFGDENGEVYVGVWGTNYTKAVVQHWDNYHIVFRLPSTYVPAMNFPPDLANASYYVITRNGFQTPVRAIGMQKPALLNVLEEEYPSRYINQAAVRVLLHAYKEKPMSGVVMRGTLAKSIITRNFGDYYISQAQRQGGEYLMGLTALGVSVNLWVNCEVYPFSGTLLFRQDGGGFAGGDTYAITLADNKTRIVSIKTVLSADVRFTYKCRVKEDYWYTWPYSGLRTLLFKASQQVDSGQFHITANQRGSITLPFVLKKNPRTCELSHALGDWSLNPQAGTYNVNATGEGGFLVDDVKEKTKNTLAFAHDGQLSILQDATLDALILFKSAISEDFLGKLISTSDGIRTVNWSIIYQNTRTDGDGTTDNLSEDPFDYLYARSENYEYYKDTLDDEYVDARRKNMLATPAFTMEDCHNAIAISATLPFLPTGNTVDGTVTFELGAQGQPICADSSRPECNQTLTGVYDPYRTYTGYERNEKWFINGSYRSDALSPKTCQVLPGTTACLESFQSNFPLFYLDANGNRKSGLQYRPSSEEIAGNRFNPRYEAMVDRSKTGIFGYKVFLVHNGHRGAQEEIGPYQDNRFGEAWFGYIDPPAASYNGEVGIADNMQIVSHVFSGNSLWQAVNAKLMSEGPDGYKKLRKLADALIGGSNSEPVNVAGIEFDDEAIRQLFSGEAQAMNALAAEIEESSKLSHEELAPLFTRINCLHNEAAITFVYEPQLLNEISHVNDPAEVTRAVAALNAAHARLFDVTPGSCP